MVSSPEATRRKCPHKLLDLIFLNNQRLRFGAASPLGLSPSGKAHYTDRFRRGKHRGKKVRLYFSRPGIGRFSLTAESRRTRSRASGWARARDTRRSRKSAKTPGKRAFQGAFRRVRKRCTASCPGPESA
jgi:hypothetical protein